MATDEGSFLALRRQMVKRTVWSACPFSHHHTRFLPFPWPVSHTRPELPGMQIPTRKIRCHISPFIVLSAVSCFFRMISWKLFPKRWKQYNFITYQQMQRATCAQPLACLAYGSVWVIKKKKKNHRWGWFLIKWFALKVMKFLKTWWKTCQCASLIHECKMVLSTTVLEGTNNGGHTQVHDELFNTSQVQGSCKCLIIFKEEMYDTSDYRYSSLGHHKDTAL